VNGAALCRIRVKFLDLNTTSWTRIVILIGAYVIKLPNFSKHKHLGKLGLRANRNERLRTKQVGSIWQSNLPIAPTLFFRWGGLVAIQLPVEVLERGMENFCFLRNSLICVDYA
jgi:hypothetical protein